jgi:hypothetical protein
MKSHILLKRSRRAAAKTVHRGQLGSMQPEVSQMPGYSSKFGMLLEPSTFAYNAIADPPLVRVFDPLAGALFNPVIPSSVLMNPAPVFRSVPAIPLALSQEGLMSVTKDRRRSLRSG